MGKKGEVKNNEASLETYITAIYFLWFVFTWDSEKNKLGIERGHSYEWMAWCPKFFRERIYKLNYYYPSHLCRGYFITKIVYRIA